MILTIADIRTAGVTLAEASDVRVQQEIDAATELIQGYCRRSFGVESEPRAVSIDGSGHSTLFLPERLSELTAVTVDGQAVELVGVANYTTRLVRKDGVFPEGIQNVVLTGRWGEPVPASIAKACARMVLAEIRPRLKKGIVASESIGKYSYQLRKTQPTGDPEIDDLIRPHRRREIGLVRV